MYFSVIIPAFVIFAQITTSLPTPASKTALNVEDSLKARQYVDFADTWAASGDKKQAVERPIKERQWNDWADGDVSGDEGFKKRSAVSPLEQRQWNDWADGDVSGDEGF